MCGLVALINLDGRTVQVSLLKGMADAITHRGPDEEGHCVDGRVGLHVKRLSIIDLAAGHQPMTAEGVTIAFNGEIYNYVELRDELKRRGREFRTSSDTEVILIMYLEYGAECVARLNGMFAFVIYDSRRGRILAARDHWGIKPLYYWKDDARLVFASEIKSFWRHPDLRPEADYDAMREYITFQFVLGDRTLFRGVHKVSPGHYLTIDLAAPELRFVRYWEPRFVVDFDHTEEYFAEELGRLLQDAVRLQLRSDVPVGSHLSGGTDSSVITALAARLYPGSLRAFAGWFREGPAFDESPYAHEVAAATGAELLQVMVTEQAFAELLPKLIYHLDEPVAGPGAFPQFVVSRLAAEHVKVVLGGQGGDELFGGYARYMVAYLEQALKGAIFETNEEREHIVSLASILPNLPYLKAYVPMFRQFWRSGVFESMDQRYFRLVDRTGGALSLFTDDFRAAYRPEEIFARFQQVFNHPSTLSYYNRMTHFDMVASLPALLHVEDRVSMAVSLESRVPLLDYRLADLVCSMPPGMKFKGGEMKYIFKKAVKDWVPPSVLARKDKMGFPVPLDLWAKGKARAFFQEVLLSPTARSRGIFDPAEVSQSLDWHDAFGRRAWGLLCLELWHQQFIDRH